MALSKAEDRVFKTERDGNFLASRFLPQTDQQACGSLTEKSSGLDLRKWEKGNVYNILSALILININRFLY